MRGMKPLTPEETAVYLDTTPPALAQMRVRKTGPRYSKLTERMIRYRVEDLDAWIESHMIDSTPP